jgi:medium-chain acyl-[acyl-carrier-protein] hydrolase
MTHHLTPHVEGPRSELRDQLAQLSDEQRSRLMQRLRSRTSPEWFIRSGPTAPAVRLFCFSYAGGGTSVFRGWRDHLPEDVEVCATQLPGRETRAGEVAYRRMEPLITDLETAITPLLDRPYILFGHSMGALVCFELTRQLRRHNERLPEHLLLSAFRAPHLPNPNIRIHHLPDEVLKTVLAKEGTPREILGNEDLMRLMLPVLRADLEVCDTYTYLPEPPLPIPLTTLGGRHDVRVGPEDLHAWNIHARSGHEHHMLPGSHMFIHESRDLVLTQVASTITSIPQAEEMTV